MSEEANDAQTSPRRFIGVPVTLIDGESLGQVVSVFTDEDQAPRFFAVGEEGLDEDALVVPVEAIVWSSTARLAHLPVDRPIVLAGPRAERDADLDARVAISALEHYGVQRLAEVIEARQAPPAPTPEIAEAEVAASMRQGQDPTEIAYRRWGV